MGKLLDALMGRQSIQPSQITSPTAASQGQPVPVAMITTPPGEMTSGSAINQAAVGAWPTLVDGGIKVFNSWRKSILKEVTPRNIPGNYGSVSSEANYGFKYAAFKGIGLLSGTMNTPDRPTYNNLMPITWGARVPNTNISGTTTAQTGPIVIQQTPTTWQGSGTASITKTGEVLL